MVRISLDDGLVTRVIDPPDGYNPKEPRRDGRCVWFCKFMNSANVLTPLVNPHLPGPSTPPTHPRAHLEVPFVLVVDGEVLLLAAREKDVVRLIITLLLSALARTYSNTIVPLYALVFCIVCTPGHFKLVKISSKS